MELDAAILRATPDGCTLVTLPSGIEIIRRKKHEPIMLEGLSAAEIAKRTDKRNGAKFLPGTTLRQIVEMTAQVLEQNQARPDSNTSYVGRLPQPIGLCCGHPTSCIRVLRSNRGRLAHGHPVEEPAND